MEYKEGAKVEALLHESGEDIIVSYRTGKTALIKEGEIKKIFDHKNYHEVNWQRADWKKAEDLEAIEREQKQLDAFHKAEASKQAKKQKEADLKKQKAASGQ
jgi:hypothetical protein